MPSSTADHILLRLADFADDPPIFLTVRTKTKEGAISADSNVVRVPRTGSGINNLFSGASTSALNNLAEALKFTNALSNAPLASASLPTSLIGEYFKINPLKNKKIPFLNLPTSLGQLPGVDLDANQLSSMTPNFAAGLLTTISSTQQGTQPANNPLNTAYPLNQAAVYFPQQAIAQQQPDSSTYTTAAQLNALSLQQKYQQGNSKNFFPS